MAAMPRTPGFRDRYDVLADMSRQLRECRARGETCRILLHGVAGVGTSSVAREFAELEKGSFERALIWVQAQRPDGSAAPFEEMLGTALTGLGVPDGELPASAAARLDAYHRRSRDEEFLLVVDGFVNADQVGALVPADAPRAAVVVTGRALDRELLPRGFRDHAVEQLPHAEARELFLHDLAGTEIDGDAVDELVRLCGGFPHLVRTLAALLVGRPQDVDWLLDELRESVATLLELDFGGKMRGFVQLAYERSMSPEERIAYRRLALLPGDDFGIEYAAFALERDAKSTRRLLRTLTDLHLLVESGGRYRYYDIVRAEARERARQEDGAELCDKLVVRVCEKYLEEAALHDRALADRWRVGPLFERLRTHTGPAKTREQALAWFKAELANAVACVSAAKDRGALQVATQLPVALFKYLHYHGHHAWWLSTHEIALEAAEGDDAAVMQLCSQRGSAHLAMGNVAWAKRDFEVSREKALAIDHPLGTQSAYEWCGKAEARAGRTESAREWYRRSWEVLERASEDEIPPEQRERAFALLRLQYARSWLHDEEPANARLDAEKALEHFHADSKERENRAKCLLVLGEAWDRLGSASATTPLREAVDLFDREGALRLQAEALVKLGKATGRRGDGESARNCFGRALALFDMLGDPRADDVRKLLDAQ